MIQRNTVNVHVGMQLRARRQSCGLSQVVLAEALGLRPQQVHKYETGASSVTASQIWQLSRILDVPVSYFFEGLFRTSDTQARNLAAKAGMALISDYESCPTVVRKSAHSLTKAMSNNTSLVTGKYRK